MKFSRKSVKGWGSARSSRHLVEPSATHRLKTVCLHLSRALCVPRALCLMLAALSMMVSARPAEESSSTELASSSMSLKVAVAANFTPALKALIKAYDAHSDQEIVVISGSTGKLFTQIEHGAPFDLFFAADQKRPAMLVKNGLALPESQFTYAIGALVLWSKRWDAQEARERLLSGRFERLAMANPKLAPYGEAAIASMASLGVKLEEGENKILEGENIAQAFQFLRFGSADLGFVSLSQIRQHETSNSVKASYWVIPAKHHSPIAQDVVVLERSHDNKNTAKFLRFIQSEQARNIMLDYGYSQP